ncbi:EAL and HDOD domain-containing protein [Thermodesulforhabdus norvegica]|uniref:EAL and modified HD-GYP domain-containing signal transduction protein n=1 Tax=Thermodesulforhabdus norvegica TaxID=39841 RepID=A0A1I4S3P6_9BACT|nr:HDOD domain-containing protein [Thermodesulforhabdus norvegica]SFM59136.1 EAL and modified HD-GYP domain-containing signal transduction protein [Thermodesulforhabdus norvegica]
MNAFVARQPIFDRNKNLWGYEILYRPASDASEANIANPEEASYTVLHNLLMVLDFAEFVDGTRGFINFPKGLILEGIPAALPTENTIIEILEDTEPGPEVLEACKRLKDRGYSIALDDFTLRNSKQLPFLEFADIIKVDCLASPVEEWGEIARTYGRSGKLLLAEKIETHEAFKQALELGFHLFQGFFFSRPVTVLRKDIPSAVMSRMKIMAELASTREMNPEDFEKLLKQDPGLTYKLLRYINSPAVGMRTRVTNIRRAVILLGEKEVRRWLFIVIYGQLFGTANPYRLFEHSLQRARYMELLAGDTSKVKPEEAFLTGLISTLDAVLECPMEEILKKLPVATSIREALLQFKGPAGTLYRLVLSHEQDSLEEVVNLSRLFGLPISRLTELYLESLRWVQQIL